MGNNGDYRNVGVRTSAELLVETSSPSSTDCDEIRQNSDASNSQEDDQSFVKIPETPSTNASESTTSASLYQMKVTSQTALDTRPNRIEFMKVNKQRRRVHKSHPLRDERRRTFVQNESIQSIPSATAHQNNAQMQNELSRKPRKRPLPSIFSWLKPRHENSSRTEWDVEAQLGPAVDKTKSLKYPFVFGSPLYYETTDSTPYLTADIVAQRALYMATKFWAGFFASINIVVVFPLTFVLQLYRFILSSIFRTIILGCCEITSDYLVKPLFAVLFNGLLQPFMILAQNIFQSIKDMLDPLIALIGLALSSVLKPFSECLGAFRIVEVKNLTKHTLQDYPRYQNLQPQEYDA